MTMKAIINGKRYDTATAAEIASWGNGLGSSDFKNCDETLYRTKKGAWFLHGDGGAMTRWARAVSNGHTGGEGIQPLTPDEARGWLERHGMTSALEKHFSDTIEDA
jgi:hypothetical protein